MRTGIWFRAIGALGVMTAFGIVVRAEDTKSDSKRPEKVSGWQKLFRTHAGGYEITVDGDGGDVQLVPEPILNWSQPVRGGAEGAVFLWTQVGRPVAIGTFFIWPRDNGLQGITHELHSLSQVPLVGTWRDRRWTPPADSIVWKPVAGSPAPANGRDERLRQMRDLARQFSAESKDKNDRKWTLRLLPRAIYRYALDEKASTPVADRDILDGALFGFVEGTDLEVVLLIQATKSGAAHRWEYALARMSDFQLAVKHRDSVIWEVDRSGYDNPRVAYYCSTVESRASADEK